MYNKTIIDSAVGSIPIELRIFFFFFFLGLGGLLSTHILFIMGGGGSSLHTNSIYY